jgi:phage shock protein A
MPLIKRLSRAFKADMHAVLDSLEEPAALLRQAVREMEDAVLNDQQRLKQLENAREQQDTTQQEYRQKLNDIEEEIDVSFAADQHDLARKAIKRKLELERAMKVLARQQQSVVNQIKELQQRLKENQDKLHAMRQKQEVLAGTNCDDTFDNPPPFSEITVTDDEVEIAFLKEKQGRAKA